MHVAPPLEETTRFRHFACPECRGTLEPLEEQTTGVVTYVCRVGHRYTGRELLIGKELMLEQMLWSSLTAMDELIVAMRELEERGDARAPSGEWRRRAEGAVRLRGQLEEVIAQNEPVRMDSEMPIETDPNSRLRREA